MPDVEGEIKFLSRLPRYKTEQPFYVSVAPGVEFDQEKHTNLEFERHAVTVSDIRPRLKDFTLDDCGFEIVPHVPKLLDFQTTLDVNVYKHETEALLQNFFQAEKVLTWDFKV